MVCGNAAVFLDRKKGLEPETVTIKDWPSFTIRLHIHEAQRTNDFKKTLSD